MNIGIWITLLLVSGCVGYTAYGITVLFGSHLAGITFWFVVLYCISRYLAAA